MRIFQVRIELENAALQEGAELVRILRQLAADLEPSGSLPSPYLYDINGNAVGWARFREETGTTMTIISEGDFAFIPRDVAYELRDKGIVYYCDKCEAFHLCDGHGWSEIPGMEGP